MILLLTVPRRGTIGALMTVPYGICNDPSRGGRRSAAARLRALLALAALAGCASVPMLGPRAARQDPAALATERSFAAPPAAWPSDRWWEAYGDPQLAGLIE